MIHKYVKISLGLNAESIQCSSCLKVLGLSSKKQKQEVFCLDCINNSPKDDVNQKNTGVEGCGKIERLPSGWGIACGEMTGIHQYLCPKCQAKEDADHELSEVEDE